MYVHVHVHVYVYGQPTPSVLDSRVILTLDEKGRSSVHVNVNVNVNVNVRSLLPPLPHFLKVQIKLLPLCIGQDAAHTGKQFVSLRFHLCPALPHFRSVSSHWESLRTRWAIALDAVTARWTTARTYAIPNWPRTTARTCTVSSWRTLTVAATE